jgi:hypothetical protein
VLKKNVPECVQDKAKKIPYYGFFRGFFQKEKLIYNTLYVKKKEKKRTSQT